MTTKNGRTVWNEDKPLDSSLCQKFPINQAEGLIIINREMGKEGCKRAEIH